MKQLDTGISRLGGKEIPIDNVPLPEKLMDDLLGDLKDGNTMQLSLPEDERYTVQRRGSNLSVSKILAYHKKEDGSEVSFEFGQESDGSKRVIELLPVFQELASKDSSKVYIIDEVDRSLHSMLSRKLLRAYLDNCSSETRSQLLFTTHDVSLMDQNLLRRDEMWLAERNNDGRSTLFSLSDFKEVRNDKDIRKSYLQGRMGGVPRILLSNSLDNC